MLPFSREAFLAVFAAYNDATWPIQFLAFGAGLAALAAPRFRTRAASRLAIFIVAGMWLWTGIVYHGLFFGTVNPAASVFALMFVAQAGLLALLALEAPLFVLRRTGAKALGAGLIVYAMALYPLIGLLTGTWHQRAAFGVTPCSLALFTLGLLLLAEPRPPRRLWIVPLLWSMIGGTAAFLLGIVQDWVLLLSGPLVVMAAFGRLPVSAPLRLPTP
jgi:hypothetical protein